MKILQMMSIKMIFQRKRILTKFKLEGFRALAYLCEEANRIDPNPKVGRLLPK